MPICLTFRRRNREAPLFLFFRSEFDRLSICFPQNRTIWTKGFWNRLYPRYLFEMVRPLKKAPFTQSRRQAQMKLFFRDATRTTSTLLYRMVKNQTAMVKILLFQLIGIGAIKIERILQRVDNSSAKRENLPAGPSISGFSCYVPCDHPAGSHRWFQQWYRHLHESSHSLNRINAKPAPGVCSLS